MRAVRNVFWAVLIFGAMATPALRMERAAAAQQKIAYVDLQRALAETDEGKRATGRIKADFEKKQKELDARQEELKRMKESLDKQGSVLKPEALAAKQQELQQKFIQLQETYVRLQKDLEQKQGTEMQKLLGKMQAVITEIAQKEGYTYVFEKNAGIVYGPPSLDLTNELIRKYNALPPAK